MARFSRRLVLAGAALVAGVLLESAMLVWSGQPETGASDAAVRHYYSAHWVAVVVGNLLWLPGSILLVTVALVGVHHYARLAPRTLRTTTVAVASIAGALMVLSSVFALVTVTVAQFASAATTASAWSAEVGSFTVAMLCWMVAAVLFAAGSVLEHRLSAAMGIFVAVLLLPGGDLALWALLTAVVVLGAATHADAPPDKMTSWTSDSRTVAMSSPAGRRG